MSDAKDVAVRQEAMVERKSRVQTMTPYVDIFENEDEILLFTDMPGVAKKDVVINIDNGKLTLSGLREITQRGAATWEEFGDVEYQRTFSVPQTIDIDKVNAELKEGVLRLHLPKSAAAKPRQISVKEA
ncbi:MAG: Hsp20/alpha crystallin family protein [Desulforhopalus sp.]|jgi:HSP20 family molecular chaperone IbpA|nr:Hsp20/alpha crystallin family protein [Desulforhopalus sp.]